MENGFDPLLVSEGRVTVGLKAISAAQDEGGGPTERRLPPLGPAVWRFKNGQLSRTGDYTHDRLPLKCRQQEKRLAGPVRANEPSSSVPIISGPEYCSAMQ